MTVSKDPEVSMTSRDKLGAKKNKLSKRESVFFKPSQKDNKIIGELLIKVHEN